MRKLLCLGLIVFSAMVLAIGAGPAGAEDYLFKYSNSQSDTHPRSQSMVFFKNLVEGASSGRIKVELYTAGVLGKEAEVLDMVKTATCRAAAAVCLSGPIKCTCSTPCPLCLKTPARS